MRLLSDQNFSKSSKTALACDAKHADGQNQYCSKLIEYPNFTMFNIATFQTLSFDYIAFSISL